MQLAVQGKQIDVGDALRTHVAEKIESLNEKFFNHATFATVTFSKEGHGHGLIKAHIHISIGKNITVMADGVEGDAYLAFDTAAGKILKQLRRYKNRLRDHHSRMDDIAVMNAADYVIESEPGEEELAADNQAPVIIAEMTMPIQSMSVGEAVMRMDLAGQNAMLFRNANHEGLNMVYRRADGNIGWVDPAIEKAAERPAKKAKAK